MEAYKGEKAVKAAARSLYRMGGKVGFAYADLMQEAYIVFHTFKWREGAERNSGYVFLAVRHGLLKRLRREKYWDPASVPDRAERREYPATALEFQDLLDSAPDPEVRTFLRLRVTQGSEWVAIREETGWHQERLVSIRAKAGRWLKEQYA